MKKTVKNFNNFIKRTIFKVENKTNDKFLVSNFSKYIIAIIAVLFIYIFYLSIPLLYDKNWVQNKIVTKLSDEFNINLSNSFDISYRILPKPHYLIKDTKTTLAEIKDLTVYIRPDGTINISGNLDLDYSGTERISIKSDTQGGEILGFYNPGWRLKVELKSK